MYAQAQALELSVLNLQAAEYDRENESSNEKEIAKGV